MTNKEMAERDPEFRRACEIAGLQPSRHHYRRYKYGRGRPYEIARTLLDKNGEKRIEIQAK